VTVDLGFDFPFDGLQALFLQKKPNSKSILTGPNISNLGHVRANLTKETKPPLLFEKNPFAFLVLPLPVTSRLTDHTPKSSQRCRFTPFPSETSIFLASAL